MEAERNQQNDSWHVGKEIPIAMLFAIFLQTAGAIWWAATMSTKLDDLSYQVAALTADKYSQHDAVRDQALIDEKIANLKQSIESIKEEVKWRKK
jgi:hypothetical protein